MAHDYHSKRKVPWKPLDFFLGFLKKKGYYFGEITLDLGCANGRNFKILGTPPKKLVGIDISFEFLKIARENLTDSHLYSKFESNFIQLILADIKYLPIRKDSVRNIFSIATIHHIRSKTNRKDLISQFNNVLKTNGNIVITVWRKWQKKYRSYFLIDGIKRKFNLEHKKHQKNAGLEEFGDKYVTWELSKEKLVYDRFYHFFSKHEIKRLLKPFTIKEFKIMGGPRDNDNFFIMAQKKS
ncbi:MAG: class I SAM-dependent methyltransferase [Promethearchaeota archaeon]|jgi:SAM-dependent methyltransferase